MTSALDAQADLNSIDCLTSSGTGDECPLVPGVAHDDGPLDDPAGQPLECVRAIGSGFTRL